MNTVLVALQGHPGCVPDAGLGGQGEGRGGVQEDGPGL